ncbi:uncharacterized protein LOC130670468 [Microplitis mediator]|uniref:uncharacterized protein LOC130670468 n=1 Tax=Microplitis mediator TaxID=375433 RepID=UPI0025562B21|nr:uncharacterized protein LOC130670468 [Microplitis mediator]
MALAFVPPDNVIAAYEEIVSSDYYNQNSDVFEQLLDYFEMTWIGKLKNNKKQRGKPLFAIKMRNCHNAASKEFIRSNNPTEGWNLGINDRVGVSHPTMQKFMSFLKDEQTKTDILITQIQSGLDVTGSRRKSYQNYTDRLKIVVNNYNSAYKFDYLNNIAKILSLKNLM